MVSRKLLYIGNSWELILQSNAEYSWILSCRALNDETFLQLAAHNSRYCIEVEAGVEFGEVLPYLFQCQYLRINNYPVLAMKKNCYNSALCFVQEISSKMELHGYKEYYWIVHDELDAHFELYQDGRKSVELESVIDKLIAVSHCHSLSQLTDSISALERRWADLQSGIQGITVHADELLEKISQLYQYKFWYDSATRELVVMAEQLKQLQTGSRAEELQKHYDEVYESLPRWHKKLGSFLRRCREISNYGRK